MRKVTKTELKKLESLHRRFKAEATELGLMENYLFARLFETYENQLELMQQYLNTIEESGLMISVPCGKDAEKLSVNPAAVEYNKMVTSSSKIASQLDAMIERAKKTTVPKDDDEL